MAGKRSALVVTPWRSLERGARTSSPAGSPTSLVATRSSISHPASRRTSRNAVRVGFSPTSRIRRAHPAMAAATRRNAADEGSPGSVPRNAGKSDAVTATAPGAMEMSAPRCRSARSV